jgi:methylglutaconyl-CoA hydratase
MTHSNTDPADGSSRYRSSEPTLVVSSTEGGVCTVTLQDEAGRNALSRRLVNQLSTALDAAEADTDVRVIVLTNSGSVFCAGADLSERSTGEDGQPETDASAGARASGPTPTLGNPDPLTLFTRIPRSSKPYVGRIAGHCVAGGMGLAAAMDISVAVDNVKMGFTEVRIGVAPAMISVLCLPKMNRADAQEAFLRGRRFPAAEAARMGLINHAVPADRLDDTVAEIVEDLLAGGPQALAATKSLVARVPRMPVDEAFRWTSRLSSELFQSDEAQAGMKAYLDKTPAPWIPAGPEREP